MALSQGRRKQPEKRSRDALSISERLVSAPLPGRRGGGERESKQTYMEAGLGRADVEPQDT